MNIYLILIQTIDEKYNIREQIVVFCEKTLKLRFTNIINYLQEHGRFRSTDLDFDEIFFQKEKKD